MESEAEGIKSRTLELFSDKFERFSKVGRSRLEEVKEERNRWKEEERRKGSGRGVVKSATSDLEVVGKTLFCGSGCEKLP